MMSLYNFRASDVYILSRSIDLLHIEPYAGNGVSLLGRREAVNTHHKVYLRKLIRYRLPKRLCLDTTVTVTVYNVHDQHRWQASLSDYASHSGVVKTS
jgi:hypothetical protein